MDQNPYKAPTELTPSPQDKKSRYLLFVAAVAGWLVFFLVPSFGVFASHAYPGPPFLDPPQGDTIFSRVSIVLGTPMEPLLLFSLIGCVASAICLPATPRWKAIAIFNAIVWWLPLMVVQILALTLVLMLLGYPPAT